MQRKDGTPIDVFVATSPMVDFSGRVVGVAGVIRDMTENRLLESQLVQSQKLEAIGSLAGGVATVHGIVRQSGGHLWLYSEPGLGTTFKVYLPVAASMPSPGVPVVPEEEPFDGGETILVVEDNNLLRPMIAEMLEPYGYTVLPAADGVEALAVAAQHPGTIDLLLTDVVMPRLNGRELAERMLAKNPETRVLFSSGYPADTVVRAGIAEARVAFIQKPYVAGDLLSKIRSTLREPS
jgi:two-component system cell cycle sensor histidine kinase/response regulator CckA